MPAGHDVKILWESLCKIICKSCIWIQPELVEKEAYACHLTVLQAGSVSQQRSMY